MDELLIRRKKIGIYKRNKSITKKLRIKFIKYLTKYSSNNQNKPGMRRVKADPQSKNSLCEFLMGIFGYDVSLCY